jgi:hypothetical protein
VPDRCGGAVVARRLPSTLLREVPLDAQGCFALQGLRAGEYRLGVGSTERGWQWLPALALAAGAELDVGAVTIAAPGSLRAEVRGEDGALDGLELHLVDAERLASIALRIEAAGLWMADGLAPGSYELIVGGARCLPQRVAIEIAPGVHRTIGIDARVGVACRMRFPFEPLDNTYDGPGVLHVAVRDAHGRGIVERRTRKLVDGAFVLELALQPGAYRVAATSVWGAHAAAELAVAPGAPQANTLCAPLRAR